MDLISNYQITGKEVEVLLSYQPKVMGVRSAGEWGNVVYDPQVEEFLQMWDVTGFSVPFDYVSWAEQNGLQLEDADAVMKFLTSAEKDDVRRLAAAVVRVERFSEGYLNTLWNKGFAQMFFEKLKDFV